MSRGLGRVQRAVVWALRDEEPQTLRQLALSIYGAEPTRTRLVSVGRAVRSLRRRNWVTATGRWRCRVRLTPSARIALAWLHTDTR